METAPHRPLSQHHCPISLHLLPEFELKTLLLTFKSIPGTAPPYPKKLSTPQIPPRSLHVLTPPGQSSMADWTFCSAAPVLRRPSLAVRGAEGTLTLDLFKDGPTDLFYIGMPLACLSLAFCNVLPLHSTSGFTKKRIRINNKYYYNYNDE